MSNVPRPYPEEVRDDVVAVARRCDAPIGEIANDFGISESWLRNWLRAADAEDGNRLEVTDPDGVVGTDHELRLRNASAVRLHHQLGCAS
jgi:transposase-like protein